MMLKDETEYKRFMKMLLDHTPDDEDLQEAKEIYADYGYMSPYLSQDEFSRIQEILHKERHGIDKDIEIDPEYLEKLRKEIASIPAAWYYCDDDISPFKKKFNAWSGLKAFSLGAAIMAIIGLFKYVPYMDQIIVYICFLGLIVAFYYILEK